MNDERPIERLLRDTAKARRAEAGAEPVLHSVNRRLLHQEVRQRFGSLEESGRRSMPVRFWPRLVWGVALVLAAGLTVFLLAPPKSRVGDLALRSESLHRAVMPSQDKAPAEPTVPPPAQDAEPIPAAAPAPSSEPAAAPLAPAAPPPRAREDVTDNFEEVGMPQARSRLDAARPTPAKDEESKLLLTFGSSSSTMSDVSPKSIEPARAGRALNEPASPAAHSPIAANFRQIESLSQQDAQILQSFTFKQEGASIVVNDMDGSAYVGTVQTRRAEVLSSGETRKAESSVEGDMIAADRRPLQEGGLFFDVSGTNNTSRKVVRFIGQLLTNQSQVAQSAGQTMSSHGSNLQNAMLNQRQVLGAAQIGGGPVFRIEALEVRE